MNFHSMWQKFFSGIIVIGLIIIFTGCTDHRKVILFLGDSITAGDGVDAKYIYPALLERQLGDIKVINQGRPDWSTDSYINKWEEVENEFPSRADIIFIQLGANDLRVHGHNDSTITICMENMKVILKKIRNHFPNAEIVLMSSTKMDPAAMDERMKEVGFGQRTNQYLSRIGEGYSMIASDNYYNFIDLYRLVPMNTTDDGAHLNKNGHQIAANLIIRFLRELMNSKKGNGEIN